MIDYRDKRYNYTPEGGKWPVSNTCLFLNDIRSVMLLVGELIDRLKGEQGHAAQLLTDRLERILGELDTDGEAANESGWIFG